MADSYIFSLYIHHGGKLYDYGGPFPFYDGGKITMKHGLDVDRFDYFDLCDEVEKLGYVSFERLGYKIPGRGEVVKYLTDDACVMAMLQYVREGQRMIILYVDGGRKGDTRDRSEDGSSEDGSEDDGGFDAVDVSEDDSEDGVADLDVELEDEHDEYDGQHLDMEFGTEDEEDEPENFPEQESDTDDELDDNELASDDDDDEY